VSSVRTVVAVTVLVVAASSVATVGGAVGTATAGDDPGGLTDADASPDESASAVASAGGVERDDAERARRAANGTNETDEETERNGSHAGVVQTVTYARTPGERGSIRATHRYRVGPNASSVVVYDYENAAVLESNGFVRRSNGRWTWDGRVDRPSLTLRIHVNGSESDADSAGEFGGPEWVDTGRWSLAHPPVEFAYRSDARGGWAYSWRDPALVERRTRFDGAGYDGSAVVYLGAHETYETSAAGQRLRLVRPRGVSERGTDPDRVLDTLATAAEQLDVGARDRLVNAFAAPEPLGRGGLTAAGRNGSQDFWVAANRTVTAPTNLWVHEYVHTRQNLSLGPGMAWFREASATYYAGVLSVRQGVDGREGFERFAERLRANATADAVLASRSTWSTPMAPYRKGMRVLAALDARIRDATDRNRTLVDVFRRLNEHPGTVGYDDFAAVVANVSGASLSDWLDAHVRGSARANPPTAPWPYTDPSGSADADGDGLTSDAERRLGTHPFAADTDGDGRNDGHEVALGTDPLDADTDRNGTSDGFELATGRPLLGPVAGSTTADWTPISGLLGWYAGGIAVVGPAANGSASRP